MKSNTVTKGLGGILVLGGVSVGIYYVNKEYSGVKDEREIEKDSETGDLAEVRKEGELEAIGDQESIKGDSPEKVVFIDSLGDNDDYWKIIGEAYVFYATIFIEKGRFSVSEIGESISSKGIVYTGSEYQRQIGQIIKDWCSGNKDKDSEKFKYWCIKKLTRSQKIKEEDPSKVLKTAKEDFNEGDYGNLEKSLKEQKLEHEKGRLADRKNLKRNDEKEAMLLWCEEVTQLLFLNSEEESNKLVKQYCFKDSL